MTIFRGSTRFGIKCPLFDFRFFYEAPMNPAAAAGFHPPRVAWPAFLLAHALRRNDIFFNYTKCKALSQEPLQRFCSCAA